MGKQDKSMYYDVNKTLSHNCLLNFVVGPRGVGKTYAAKRKMIRDFLKDGSQFIYLRRYDTEVKTSQMELLFSDMDKEFPDCTIEYKRKVFLCNNEPMGWAIPLSRAAQYKSVPFPRVNLIVFDEFIIDQGLIRYLPDEVQSFNEMYSTIARLRDVRVLFLSNAITFVNPYFVYYDLQMPSGKNIYKKGDVLIEMVDSPVYSKEFANTRFGKIMRDKAYGDYAINNKFLRDNEAFIVKMPPGMNARATIVVDGVELGIYTSIKDGWVVSEKVDPTVSKKVALVKADHTDETNMKQSINVQFMMEELQQKFYQGTLHFTSIKAKNLLLNKITSIRG